MTRLPPALAPWRPQLALLPLDLAAVVGSWVRRLLPVVGPKRMPDRWDGDAPDGYRGLGRRGSYDRLVTAEWALARAHPLEFLRRATMHEHLFLETARSAPHGGRRTVLLLDVGPDQLGAPRTVHLALLVLFAQRAASAGTDFSWGVLQRPDQRLIDEVDSRTVAALMASRSAECADAGHLDVWRARLLAAAPRATRPVDELWLAGASDLLALCSDGISVIAVEDPLIPGRRVLSVTVASAPETIGASAAAASGARHGRSMSLTLDLPSDDDCTRLLRNPFAAPPRMPRRELRPQIFADRPRFADRGSHLLMRRGDGTVVAHRLGEAPDALPRPPMRLAPPTDGRLAAIGLRHRAFVSVHRSDDTLYVHGPRRRPIAVTLPRSEGLAGVPQDQLPYPCYARRVPGVGTVLLIHAEGGRLLQLVVGRARDEASPPPAIRHLGFAAALLSYGPHMLMVSMPSADAPRRLLRWRAPGDVETLDIALGAGGTLVAHVGWRESAELPLIALHDEDDRWLVLDGERVVRLRPARGQRVIGVVAHPVTTADGERGYAPCLVVCEPDGHTLAVRGRRLRRRLGVMPSAVRDGTTSHGLPVVAVRCVDGRQRVVDLHPPADRAEGDDTAVSPMSPMLTFPAELGA